MIESRTGSGLYIAEQSADMRSVSDALKAYDKDLRLVPQIIDGQQTWMVFRYAGGDKPAELVTGWRNEYLEPLPLSHRLVEYVKQLDRNTRTTLVDSDEHNEKLKQQRIKEGDELIDEMAREGEIRAKRSPVLHRGQHLRRSRHKDGNMWDRRSR